MNSLAAIFGAGGILEKNYKNYENRTQQFQMAEAVEQAICQNRHLIVEAGTGVGKTLAYLIPSVFWTTKNKKRVIISTYTKILQEQITEKDLPFLQKILPVEFNFALCVGSENYLCIRRLKRYYQLELFDKQTTAEKILAWAKKTETGLKLELNFAVADELWQSICRESDLCLGKKCAHKNQCFYSKSKIKQYKSEILVANHHLFFTNIASGERVLPRYDAAVFDEAQNIEEVAADHLGLDVSNTAINYLLSRLYNPQKNTGIHRLINFSKKDTEHFIDAVVAFRELSVSFFSEILTKFGNEPTIKRIYEPNIVNNILEPAILNLTKILKQARLKTDDDETQIELKRYASRLLSINSALNTIIQQEYDNYVYWVDILQKRRGLKIVLYAAPIDVAPVLKEVVFEKISIVILTSATLSVNNKFDFMKAQLGLIPEKIDELLLDSPFDYKNNVILYIPENIPDPKYDDEKFNKKCSEEIEQILEITQGRAFCLFTSYQMLENVYQYLSELNRYEVFKQGKMPRWQMLDKFKKRNNAVLLGVDTFWQGVDVPGRALECVIITRLPFAVPDEPLTEAKIEFLEKQGKEPFIHYQLPQAVIMFRQGFGRLIRHKNDIGVVAVLDPRIRTRGYGQKFLNSLPDCQKVTTIQDLKTSYTKLTLTKNFV
ncbi:MAG: helicase C-terminal domain-containing protein [Elusimicrobiota bacterium]